MRRIGRANSFLTGGITGLNGHRRELGLYIPVTVVPTIYDTYETPSQATGAYSLTFPAGLAVGDICVVIATSDTGVVTIDAGWDSLGSATVNPEFYAWSREIDGTESAGVSIADSANSGSTSSLLITIRGGDYNTIDASVDNLAYIGNYFNFNLALLTEPLAPSLLLVVGGMDDKKLDAMGDVTFAGGIVYTYLGRSIGHNATGFSSTTMAWAREWTPGDPWATDQIYGLSARDTPAAMILTIR